MLYPIIDIGSNTVKLSVLDSEKVFAPVPVFFKAVPLGLRGKIHENRLLPEAQEALCSLIAEYKAISSRLTQTPPLAFATASLRGLENAREILQDIENKTGIRVDLIPGESEAYFSFLGARGYHHYKSGFVVDLGGGSTEILSFRGKKVLKCVSLPFGCLTLTRTFFTDGADYEGCRSYIDALLKKNAPRPGGRELLLTGGSAKAVLKYKNTLSGKKNAAIPAKALKEIRENFAAPDSPEKQKLRETLKERFTLVPAAVTVFSAIAEFYRKDSMTVCKCGVREGYLSYHLAGEKKIKKAK